MDTYSFEHAVAEGIWSFRELRKAYRKVQGKRVSPQLRREGLRQLRAAMREMRRGVGGMIDLLKEMPSRRRLTGGRKAA